MKILYKIATRGRVKNLFRTLDNIIQMAVHPDYEILISMDIDDAATTRPEIRDGIKAYGNKVKAIWGTSKSKIEAINADIWMVDGWQILCIVSDDQVFTKWGFDKDIIEAFDGFSGLAHFVDRFNKGTCTMAIMGRTYFNIDGWVYHPKFYSVYSDDFQKQLAKKRGMYKFINKEIFQHNHYRWGLSEMDELYERNDNREAYERDRAVYLELKKEYGLI